MPQRTSQRRPGTTPRLATHAVVGAFGLGLIAAAPLVVFLASLAAGLPVGGVVMPGVLAVVVGAFGFASLRAGRRVRIAALAVAVLAIGPLHWMFGGFRYPASLADFVPAVLLTTGVALAVGGHAATLANRRSVDGRGAARLDRLAVGGASIVVTAAVAASAVLFATARDEAPLGSARADAVVDMRATAFEPSDIAVPAGTGLVLVRNRDPFFHTFTVPSLGVNAKLLPGEATLVEISSAPGRHVYYCAPHADMSEADPSRAGMAGRLRVG